MGKCLHSTQLQLSREKLFGGSAGLASSQHLLPGLWVLGCRALLGREACSPGSWELGVETLLIQSMNSDKLKWLFGWSLSHPTSLAAPNLKYNKLNKTRDTLRAFSGRYFEQESETC